MGVVTVFACLLPDSGKALCQSPVQPRRFDVVVYGGTSAAVIAAVEVKSTGQSVAIVCPDKHLGGLTSGGLGWTDTGNKAVIGGLARDFYQRIWQHYDQEDAWKWQTRAAYGNRGQGNPAIDGKQKTQWIFEPHVAEAVFEQYIKQFQIPVFRDHWLDRDQGVRKVDNRIDTITMLNGAEFAGKVFIDATYEGDLMAAAGVDYHVGRESQQQYGEQWNGIQTGVLHHRHHFGVLPEKISPYRVPEDPRSGLLPRISPDPPGEFGAADHRVQAYCFRLCMTDHPDNRIPFPKPEGYDPQQYELLGRIFAAGWREVFSKFDPIPNRKTDTNNHGPFSSDNIGYNYDYPDAGYLRRQEIIQEHRRYQQGLLYFMCTDPRVPADLQQKLNTWGLAADEFADNDHWPHQIYVREARRMRGRHVMTENELLKRRPTPQPIGMGSYTIDSHNVQRYVTPEGYVQNEGDIGVPTKGPYQISLGSIQPREQQAANLLVPVAVSSSHIAFGSIRMEPVFMILGQSAGVNAVLAIQLDLPVQQVPYDRVEARLIKAGQVLHYDGPASGGISLKSVEGIVIDDEQAERLGQWQHSTATGGWIHRGYLHDGAAQQEARLRFQTDLPAAAKYRVEFAYPPLENRSTATAVTIHHRDGATTVHVNQQRRPENAPFESLGEFEFSADRPAIVEVSNKGADGYVVADAVRWIAISAAAKQ